MLVHVIRTITFRAGSAWSAKWKRRLKPGWSGSPRRLPASKSTLAIRTERKTAATTSSARWRPGWRPRARRCQQQRRQPRPGPQRRAEKLANLLEHKLSRLGDRKGRTSFGATPKWKKAGSKNGVHKSCMPASKYAPRHAPTAMCISSASCRLMHPTC